MIHEWTKEQLGVSAHAGISPRDVSAGVPKDWYFAYVGPEESHVLVCGPDADTVARQANALERALENDRMAAKSASVPMILPYLFKVMGPLECEECGALLGMQGDNDTYGADTDTLCFQCYERGKLAR